MRGKKKDRFFVLVLGLAVLIFVLVVFLIFFEFGVFGYFFKGDVVEIELKDECSLMFESIVHQIKDEGDCEMMCRNECSFIGLGLKGSDFEDVLNSCNNCVCYCY